MIASLLVSNISLKRSSASRRVASAVRIARTMLSMDSASWPTSSAPALGIGSDRSPLAAMPCAESRSASSGWVSAREPRLAQTRTPPTSPRLARK